MESSKPKVKANPRCHVWKFFRVEEIIKKISKVSKKDRENVMYSKIVWEGIEDYDEVEIEISECLKEEKIEFKDYVFNFKMLLKLRLNLDAFNDYDSYQDHRNDIKWDDNLLNEADSLVSELSPQKVNVCFTDRFQRYCQSNQRPPLCNILSNLRVYRGRWNGTGHHKYLHEEIELINKIKVENIKSDFIIAKG